MSNLNDSFEVRNKEIEDLLRDIGQRLKEVMPKDYGFSLLIFNYGEGGDLFYISSAKRDDMIKAMKEFINKND